LKSKDGGTLPEIGANTIYIKHKNYRSVGFLCFIVNSTYLSVSSFIFTKIFHVIWAHFRHFVPETGLCGVPLSLHSLRERYAPLQSLARFVHDSFFGNDRPVNVKLPFAYFLKALIA
jgi:hypothetical protein